MSKTHKITQLKKRIAELERMLNSIPALDSSLHQKRRDIVELTSVVHIGTDGRYTPSEESMFNRCVNDMFDLREHPEISQLFTFTNYVSRVDPMIHGSEIHAYELKCYIVKPEKILVNVDNYYSYE